MKRQLIICECGWSEHQATLIYDSDEEDPRFRQLFLEIHLSTWCGFWQRLKAGIRYVRGHKSRYGAFDEIIVNPDTARLMRKFIAEYLAFIGGPAFTWPDGTPRPISTVSPALPGIQAEEVRARIRELEDVNDATEHNDKD